MSSDQTPEVLPFIVAPTGSFDGDDGSWSTFTVDVGTPPQSFRVLPNLVGEEIWVPATQGCDGALINTTNCGDLRGVNDFMGEPSRGYNITASSTYNATNLFQLNTQRNLWVDDAGLYGLDTVGLGTSGPTNASNIPDQSFAQISTVDSWLGALGLGTFTSIEGTPSLLTAMRNMNLSTSLSFGYTAGQSYASPQIPGSLILGGYDSARVISSDTVSTNISATSRTQQLPIGLSSIVTSSTLDGSQAGLFPASSPPIMVNIDSATSYLWLPEAICDLFADAFGLTYDSNTQLYTVNSTNHAKLVGNQPSITFKIGGNAGSSGSANIVIGYNAFDLTVGIPLYPSDTTYFPIRRAANATQYTLGRAFLQEAYIIVDWERSNFTVAQAVAQDATPSIVPILSPSVKTTSTHTAQPIPISSSAPSTSGNKFPSGAIAGIVIAVIVVAAIAAGVFLFRRRRQNKRRQADHEKHESGHSTAPEYDAGVTENYPPEKTDAKYDYPGTTGHDDDYKRPGVHERKHSELSDTQLYELEHPHDGINRQLMSSPVHSDRELGGTPIMELEGSPYIGSELDVGYGPMDDAHPPETGAASTVIMSPASPRLIDETIRSPTRRITLEDAPYEDEPDDLRDRVVSGVVSEMSDLRSVSRTDCRSPDFSDIDGQEASLGQDTPLNSAPPLLSDVEKPPVVAAEERRVEPSEPGERVKSDVEDKETLAERPTSE